MWKGPEVDGITQSIINTYLQDPYSAYLYLILELKEDVPLHPNLIWGDAYHKGLEYLIENRDYPFAVDRARKHLRDHYSGCPTSYQWSIPKMLRCYDTETHHYPQDSDVKWKTELLLDRKINIDGRSIRFRGKVDAITHNHPDYGKCLGEHKCKGYIDPELTGQELIQDLQCNIYMYLEDVEWVIYDLIKIPDVQKYGPKKSYDETSKQWINKLYSGPVGSYGGAYPIYLNQAHWVHQKPYFISRESQQDYWDFTVIPIIKQICRWYEHVTQSDFDHENPDHFNEFFYRKPIRHFDGRNTESFKCNYHSLLIGDTELSDLIPVQSHFAELEEV